ncbi:MAG: hypothetical protein GY754_07865, partial [bacterium]|nr:hypothetical protein [bacterium]
WAKLTGFRRLLLLSVVLTALLWGVLYAKPAVEEYEDTFVEGMALVYYLSDHVNEYYIENLNEIVKITKEPEVAQAVYTGDKSKDAEGTPKGKKITLKKKARSVEKVIIKKSWNYLTLTDVFRYSLIYNNSGDLKGALPVVIEEMKKRGWEIISYKNRFNLNPPKSPKVINALTDIGEPYVDLLMNIKVPLDPAQAAPNFAGGYVVGELQIHLKELHDLKKAGHAYYKLERELVEIKKFVYEELKEIIKSPPPQGLTPKQLKAQKALEQQLPVLMQSMKSRIDALQEKGKNIFREAYARQERGIGIPDKDKLDDMKDLETSVQQILDRDVKLPAKPKKNQMEVALLRKFMVIYKKLNLDIKNDYDSHKIVVVEKQKKFYDSTIAAGTHDWELIKRILRASHEGSPPPEKLVYVKKFFERLESIFEGTNEGRNYPKLKKNIDTMLKKSDAKVQ